MRSDGLRSDCLPAPIPQGAARGAIVLTTKARAALGRPLTRVRAQLSVQIHEPRTINDERQDASLA